MVIEINNNSDVLFTPSFFGRLMLIGSFSFNNYIFSLSSFRNVSKLHLGNNHFGEPHSSVTAIDNSRLHNNVCPVSVLWYLQKLLT